MRSLKFRAWDNEKRKFLSGDYEPISVGDSKVVTGGDWQGVYYTDEYVIEQYTCLKDKNGKEIYEGDIVKQTLVEDPFRSNFPSYIVCWDEKFLGWALKDTSGDEGNDTDLHFFADNSEKIEVIGNIHENRELLGDKE